MIIAIIITALTVFIPTAWWYERQLDLLTDSLPPETKDRELQISE